MNIKIKIPTKYNGSAQGIKIFINETEIPFISKMLHAEKCPIYKTDKGLYEFTCSGVKIYEDKRFKTLQIEPINEGE